MDVSKCNLMEAIHIEKGSTVIDAARLLKEKGIRQLLVTDTGKPVGVVAAVDIINKVVAEEKNASEVKVGDIMNAPVFSCPSSDNVVRAYFYMVEKNVLSLPVVEDESIKGILTIQEALKYIKEKKEKAE